MDGKAVATEKKPSEGALPMGKWCGRNDYNEDKKRTVLGYYAGRIENRGRESVDVDVTDLR